MPSLAAKNPLWEKFALYYAKTGNATLSYTKAGFNGKNAKESGYHLAHKKEIRARVAELVDSQLRLSGVDKNWVLGKIKEKAENAKHDRDQLQALKMLGDHLALWKEKRPVGPDPLESLDTVTLIERARELIKSLGEAGSGKHRDVPESPPHPSGQVSQKREEVSVDDSSQPGREDLRGRSGGDVGGNGMASVQDSSGSSEQGVDSQPRLPDATGNNAPENGGVDPTGNDRKSEQSRGDLEADQREPDQLQELRFGMGEVSGGGDRLDMVRRGTPGADLQGMSPTDSGEPDGVDMGNHDPAEGLHMGIQETLQAVEGQDQR